MNSIFQQNRNYSFVKIIYSTETAIQIGLVGDQKILYTIHNLQNKITVYKLNHRPVTNQRYIFFNDNKTYSRKARVIVTVYLMVFQIVYSQGGQNEDRGLFCSSRYILLYITFLKNSVILIDFLRSFTTCQNYQ